jgi:hypothetical protein
MEWAFRPGDFGSQFVSARVVTRNADGGMSKYIINDGGTGLAEQLAQFTQDTGKTGGLFARHGLRESEYAIDADGAPLARNSDPELIAGKASTFYVNTSA